MSYLHYPAVTEYRLPKKNIIVISCIDLRLTEEVLNFLHFDNLTNRYDIFALAGTSVSTGATREGQTELFKKDILEQYDSFVHWKQSLYDHINIAIALHAIEDVYIIEHEDCGAYRTFLKDANFGSIEEEVECHKKFATALSKDIQVKFNLNVHCFMLDIRGNVKLLDTATGS
jgi:carbonic anhydrase